MESKHPLYSSVIHRSQYIVEIASKDFAEVQKSIHERYRCKDKEVPLIIAPFNDSTASHFFNYCLSHNYDVIWIAYEDIFQNYISLDNFKRTIKNSSGIYHRAPREVSPNDCIIGATIRACLYHNNLISPGEYGTNWSKPAHLHVLNKYASIPKTYITSNVPKIKNGIMKPVSSFPAFTIDAPYNQNITLNGPFLVQNRLFGTEIRVHIIDSRIFCHAIESKGLDYRVSGVSSFRAQKPSIQIESLAMSISKLEHIRFIGIDLFECQDSLYILEANPMPGYHSYEKYDMSWDISEALYNTLSN